MRRSIKPERLCRELEEVADRLFAEVRTEQGSFQTGSCFLRGRRVLFLNNRQSIDERIAAIAREIARCDVDGFYLKPAVRAEVERYIPVPEAALGP